MTDTASRPDFGEAHAYLRGVYNIVPTPFDQDGALDEASLRRLVNFVVATGVSGITILGVLGEAGKLSEAERMRTIEVALDATYYRSSRCGRLLTTSPWCGSIRRLGLPTRCVHARRPHDGLAVRPTQPPRYAIQATRALYSQARRLPRARLSARCLPTRGRTQETLAQRLRRAHALR